MASVFGVHLGRTTISLAIFQDGKTDIVPNDAGDRTTPAVVAFNGKEKSVGVPALQGLIRNSANTVCKVKSLIGRTIDDDQVQAYIRSSPCKLTSNQGELKFELEDEHGKKYYISLREIVILLYKKAMQTANSRCGEAESHDAVITVPRQFTPAQQEIMREAAEEAGFNVLQVISEPSASLLAYNVGLANPKESEYCVVYRLGGASLDVTAIHVFNGLYDIIARIHQPDIGGESMTQLLVNYAIEEFHRKFHLDVTESRRSMAKLLVAAENCKCVLTTMSTAQCFVESLHEGVDFNCNITRARYESMLSSVLTNYLTPIKLLLQDSSVEDKQISKVVLSGGATKTPLLQQAVAELFPDAEVLASIAPSEVIAVGAATQAALLVSHPAVDMNVLVPRLSGGIHIKVIENGSSRYKCIIPSKTVVPAHRQLAFLLPNQRNSFRLEVWEGPSEECSGENKSLLGKIIMKELPPNAEISATFHVRRDGSLSVTCTEKISAKTEAILVEAKCC